MNTAQELIVPAARAERERPYSPPALVPGGDGAMVMQIIERMMREATFDPVAIREMLAIKKEYEADEARKAYMDAMAEFKKNPPIIYKNKHVGYNLKTGGRQDYDHATHDEVTLKIVAALAQFGFSHKWVPSQPDGQVRVDCVITHRLGHSESVHLVAPPDMSGNKSPVQGILSTKTLLERHLLLAVTGLSASDMPDADDRTDETSEPQTIGEGQIANIKTLLSEVGANEESFLRVIKAKSIADIHVESYSMVIGLLEAKRKQS